MDVLEHMITALRTILDYVGVDIQDLPQPEWLNQGQSIRYRTLVRLIATLLPAKPARRLHLQPLLIGGCDKFGGSMESLLSGLSDPPTDLEDVHSEDLVWVEEDLGDNCIQLRAKNRNDMMNPGLVEEMDEGVFVLRHQPERTSTPIGHSVSHVSMMSQADPGAMMKISILEDELTKLRQQIALIVVAQEQVNLQKSTCVLDSPSVILPDSGHHEMSELHADHTQTPPSPSPPSSPSMPTPPPARPSVPVPPPPPPPPSCFSNTPHTSSTSKPAQRSLAEMLIKKKDQLEEFVQEDTPLTSGTKANMCDVLKGLGSIKLRAVERSPGGTPIREKPRPTNHNDPAFLIAQALKKKFAFRNIHDSPETDKENDFSSSSTENTPKAPFGPHLLKRAPGRRSGLCADSTERRPSLGPLRDLNSCV